MTEFNRNDTVHELDRIAELFDSKNELEEKIYRILQEGKEKADEEAHVIINELEDYQKKAEKGFDVPAPKLSALCFCKPPAKPTIDNPKMTVWIGALAGISWICLIILVILFAFFQQMLLSVLSWLASMAAGALWIKYNSNVEDYLYWLTIKKNWENRCNAVPDFGERDRFINECVKYEQKFFSVVEDCSEHYRQQSEKYVEICNRISSFYLDQANEVQKELGGVEDQLSKVTLIQPDLFENAALISKLLRTQRADSLKEAINLAIEEVRKDEQEYTRREEARRQEAILEDQALRTRLHNDAMERVAERQAAAEKEHADRMEAQARAQVEETKRLRQEIERQNKANNH